MSAARAWLRGCVLAALLAGAGAAPAADTPLAFDDPLLQQRYDDLLAELRCLVCQNQSLADSHADLAQDLRDEVYRMVSAGASNAEVHAFMVERYGDFVLYRPPVKSSTLLLWLAPALLVATAAIVMVRLARRRVPPPAALSEAERARLAALVAAKRDDAPATDTHAGAHERRGEPPGPA